MIEKNPVGDNVFKLSTYTNNQLHLCQKNVISVNEYMTNHKALT